MAKVKVIVLKQELTDYGDRNFVCGFVSDRTSATWLHPDTTQNFY